MLTSVYAFKNTENTGISTISTILRPLRATFTASGRILIENAVLEKLQVF